MNKWEQLNSELADARHYAADMKERAEAAERERDELRAKAAKWDAVPVNAILRDWDGYGIPEDTAAIEAWVIGLWESGEAQGVICGN